MSELAVGYVSIVAETRGLGRSILDEIRSAERAAAGHGRAIGTQLSKGVAAAKPIDVSQLERNFTDSEKRREAAIRRTTNEVEGLRRKEAIAQAQLTEAEAKYAENSSQVLRAKDRVAVASDKLMIAEAKATVEIDKANRSVDDAKRALDEYRGSAERSAGDIKGVFSGIASAAGDLGRGVGKSLGDAGRGIGDTFRKIATGDFRGAWDNIKSGASDAAGGIKGAFEKVKGIFSRTAQDGADGGSETGKRFSKGLESEMDSGSKRAGSIFIGNLKAIFASKVIGGIVGGVKSAFSTAFGSGWSRVINIEEAQSKLSGLGHSAESVEAIMKDALAAVKGTAYGLGDAASVAASAVAAGVSPGRDLERTLRLAGDAAAIAGTDMGQMGAIFNKVAASNKMQMDVVNQLQDQGVPILQLVAEEFGITTEEAQALASKGAISFDVFRDAIEMGMGGGRQAMELLADRMGMTVDEVWTDVREGRIAMEVWDEALAEVGGAAQAMGTTFQGSFANVKAALGRMGAAVLGPVKDSLTGVFSAAIPVVDTLTESMGPATEALGTFLTETAGPAVTRALEALPGKINSGLGSVKSVFAEAQGGLAAFKASWSAFDGDVTSTGFAGVMERIAYWLRTALEEGKRFFGGFVEGFGGLDNLFSTFKDLLPLLMGPLGILKSAFMELFSGKGDIDMAGFGRTVGSVLRPVAETLATVGNIIVDVVLQALRQLMPVVMNLAQQLLPVFVRVIGLIAPLFVRVAEAVMPLVATLLKQLVPVVANLIEGVLPPLLKVLDAVIGTFLAVVDALMPWITAVVSQLIPVISSVVENVVPALVSAFNIVADVITGIVLPVFTAIVRYVAGAFTAAWTALGPTISKVFDFISRTIRNAMNFVQGLIKTVLSVIRGDWSGAWDGIKRMASALWDQIKNVISTYIELVRTIIAGVLGKIAKAWSDAWDGIKRIASALWDQIKNVISGAIEGVRTGIATALDKIAKAWSDAWGGIKRVASDLWGQISKVISGAIEGVRSGIDAALGKIAKVWSDAWGGLKSVGQAAWDWIKSTASGVFEALRGSVEGSFRNMKSAVETIWNGIKGVVARPINAVIGFINKGVIGAYNWVADKVGLKALGTIALLPGYKSGGYTGRVDPNQIAGVTHGNEYVLTSRETDALGGPSGVEAWKALALGRGYKTGGAVRPVPGGHFGWNGGRYKSGKWHGGLDFGGSLGSPAGTAIRAMWAGVVTKALRLNRSYGHHAVLDHGGGLSTLYAHMSRLGVNVGQRVGAGEVIGRVGNTGNSQGAHLHLEVRRGGKQTNPEPYLSGAATLRNIGAAVSDGLDGVVDWFKGLTDKFGGIWNKAPKGGLFGDLASGVAKKLVDELKVWAKDKLNPIGGYAAGTASAAPGWAWVGERGPELMRFRGGETVLPAPQSARMAAGGISIGQLIVDFASIDELPKLIAWLEGLRRMQRMGVVS